MTYVDHRAQAHTASIAGRGPYSRVEPGVRAQFQSFSSSVSVLWRIMLGSQQDPTTARTRRRLRLRADDRTPRRAASERPVL
jgi:hypothetical protein